MPSRPDPWQVLGLHPGAPPEAVRRAWRTLAARHHPDAGGDTAVFLQLVTARDQLLGRRRTSSARPPTVQVVRRPSVASRLLRPLRRRIDRRLNPRVA